MPHDSVWVQMAEVLEETAQLTLNDPAVDPVRRDSQSQADWEQTQLRQAIGTDTPALWISELTGAYLAEAANELLALALLLRHERVTGSVEVLVRAVIERIGRIAWVLDNDAEVTPVIRAIRGSFETAASLQHYRRAVKDLGAPNSDVRVLDRGVRQNRTQIESWFSDIHRPPEDASDSDSLPTSEVAKWSINGETYPTYEHLAKWALDDGTISGRTAIGTYGALSSFSHPSFVASREHRIVDGQRVTFSYDFGYIERLVRLALFSFSRAFKLWLSYYDHDHDRLVAHLDEIQAKWEAIGST